MGDLIKELKAEGIGIFLISHDIHDVFDLADRIVVMKNGQVVGSARTQDVTAPLIFGGDFNMRHSEDRWAGFSEYHPLTLVHEVCVDSTSGCEVKMSWDGDAPWMDTQDLQFFADGEKLTVRPVRVEALFDGGASGAQLSDHDGFLVTYELRWPAEMAAKSGCRGD